MNYEETIELEQNVLIKNRADKIMENFRKNVSLKVCNHQGGGKFLYWSDSNNRMNFVLRKGCFHFEARFLHETYDIEMCPSAIFNAIKRNYQGVRHLESLVGEQRL